MSPAGAAVLPARANPLLLGHEPAERLLLEAVRGGRLPHAWLIGGIAGIGKATLAFRFARFLLSGAGAPDADLLALGDGRAPESLAVDPASPVFSRVAAGGHADLLTVERRVDERGGRLKTEIAVEDVRRISPFLHLTAAEGGWRVVVVDGAERMNASGQNAILKILEEPPRGAMLLLACDSPGALLPTIRSRTRKLLLKPLGDDIVLDLLGRYRPDLAADDRRALASLAGGSIGRAIDLAEAGGLDLYRELMALLAALPRLDVAAVHGFADKLARRDNEAGYVAVTSLLGGWLARRAQGVARGAVEPPVDDLEFDRWLEVWEKVTRLLARADSANLDRKQVVINALLTIEAAAAA